MADTYQSNYTGLEIDERLGWAEEIVPHKEDKSNPHEVTAAQTSYDNSTSGLTAENAQDAIDAVKNLVDTNTQFTDVDNVVYSWRFIKSAEGHMQLEYTEVI